MATILMLGRMMYRVYKILIRLNREASLRLTTLFPLDFVCFFLLFLLSLSVKLVIGPESTLLYQGFYDGNQYYQRRSPTPRINLLSSGSCYGLSVEVLEQKCVFLDQVLSFHQKQASITVARVKIHT